MDLWHDSIKTMALMIAATLIAVAISIPVGVVMSRSRAVRRIMTPLLDLMQTLPSFVYLIPVVMIFGPGKIPALIATIVYAAPPLVRLTDLGLRLVDRDVLEAARAFGTTPRPAPARRADSAGAADHPGRRQPDDDDGAGHGGHRLDDRRRRSRLPGAAGHRPARGQPRPVRRSRHRRPRHRLRPHQPGLRQTVAGAHRPCGEAAHDATRPRHRHPQRHQDLRPRAGQRALALLAERQVQGRGAGRDRPRRRPQRRLARHRARAGLRRHGPVRLGQVDADPPRQPPDRSDLGRDPRRRRRRARHEPARTAGVPPHPDRHGVPEVRPAAASLRHRQRRLRPRSARRRRGAPAATSPGAGSRPSGSRGYEETPAAPTSPAASSSASASPGPSRSMPTSS